MQCTNCEAEIKPGEQFCGTCGHPVKETVTDSLSTMTCAKCGASLSTDDRFCGECGTTVLPRPGVDASEATTKTSEPRPQVQQRHNTVEAVRLVSISEPAATPEPDVATMPTQRSRAKSGKSIWGPLFLITIGWGFGIYAGFRVAWFLGQDFLIHGYPTVIRWLPLKYGGIVGWTLGWALGGLIGGVTTALALRWANGWVKIKQIAIIATVWVISFAISNAIGYPLMQGSVGDFWVSFLLTMQDISGIAVEIAIFGFTIPLVSLSFALGGLLVAFTLNLKWKLITSIGWIAGGIVGAIISMAAQTLSYESIYVKWVSYGAIAGAIGGYIMLWQFNKVRNREL